MNNRGFSSRLGFILSTAAFSIGIGNLWKFPYVVGNNGGGAFLLIYLVMVLLVGIPAFLIELTLGRSAQLSPFMGMRKLEGKKKTGWGIIGFFGCFSIFIICSYATMIVGGWTGGYIVKILTGAFKGLNPDEIAGVFGSFAGNPITLVFAALQALLLWYCLTSGIKKGVEKVCSVLLPALFIIMIVLAVYSNTLPGAFEGLKWYLIPDFSKVTSSSIAAAATQVFFSIGIGMCGGFVYGSYFSKESNLTGSVVLTGVLDTCIAVLAGILVVPALFSYGIEPTAGPSLIYITLPQLFNEMGSLGTIFGALFMLCVFFAGFTSILGGSEGMVACLCDSGKMNRKKASTLVVIAQFLVSILFTLSFGTGALSKVKIMNLGFFDFADFLSSLGLCLSVAAMLAYVLFRWGFKKFKEEANAGANSKIRVYDWMKPYICYIFPIVMIVVIYWVISAYI